MAYTIYGSNKCPMCDIAKDLLSEEGISFTYINAYDMYKENWRQIFTDLKCSIPSDWKTIPIIFQGEKFIGGARELESHLSQQITTLKDF